MAGIIAVCRSEQKGTKKEVVAHGVLREEYGLIDDAHADSETHRQVSLRSKTGLAHALRRARSASRQAPVAFALPTC